MTTRRIKIQLAIFTVVSLAAAGAIVFGYVRVPAMLGIGRYTVTVDLPRTGGLYERANVTYRGTEVGRVTAVRLTDTGVRAVLSLRSDVAIPSDVEAQVHSENAVGEQFLALLPLDANAAPLRDGDVISPQKTFVPPEVAGLLDATNRGLQAIPRDNLKTVVDEAYLAVQGLGPEIRRLVKGSTTLAIDAGDNLDAITTVIDKSQPVLDSQADTSDAIRAWAAHLAAVTRQLKGADTAVAGIVENGGPAAEDGRQFIERLRPTLPVLLANLASAADIAVTYNAGVEQLLVLLPQATAMLQGFLIPDRYLKDHKGAFLDFDLNLNLPPPCTTGFLPWSQMRTPSEVDPLPRPEGDLYCRIPQDSPINVRGIRNTPCLARPGKRAPTAKMCRSDEEYVPLNDGLNWKGDPNATLSGQDIPQQRPGSPPPAGAPTAPMPPIAVGEYDPSTGSYLGPDGRIYYDSNLAQPGLSPQSWQNMLIPQGGQ